MILYLSLFILIFPFYNLFSNSEFPLKRFLYLSEKNNPDYKLIHTEMEKIQFYIDQQMPSRIATLNIRNEKGYNSADTANTSLVSAVASTEILTTGTTLSASHTKTTRPDRQEKVSELRLNQPILRNFLGRDNRLRLDALENEKKVQHMQLLEQYETYLVNTINLYLDYKKTYLDLNLSEKILKETNSLHENVKKRFKSSVASKTDLDRSELLYLSRNEEYINKKNALKTKQLEIEKILGSSFSIANIESENLLPFFDQKNKLANSTDTISHWRENQITQLRTIIADQQLTLAKRADYPDLSLVAGYSKDDSQRFLTAIEREETIIGLRFEMPLGDSLVKSNERIAVLNKFQAEHEKAKNEITLKNSIDELNIRISEIREKVSVGKRKVQLMQNILKDEQRRYAIGRIEIDRIIEANNSFSQIRFALLSDEIDFIKSLVEYHSTNDSLLDIAKNLIIN